MCWRNYLSILTAFLLFCPLVVFPQQRKEATSSTAKIAPTVYNSVKQRKAKNLRILVKDKVMFEERLRANMPSLKISSAFSGNQVFTVSDISQQDFKTLLGSPWVSFIDVANRKAKDELTLDKSDFTVNKISPLAELFPTLNGQGLVVSLKERPFDRNDIDFKGRIEANTLADEPASVHATTMATLIAGGGNTAPSGKGVAWKARLASSSYQELMPDDGNMLTANNISVQNHSYGVDIENYYGIEAFAYDQYSWLFPKLLHVFSSGNAGMETASSGTYAGIEGVANLTGQFKQSKNTLSVGASDLNGQVVPQSSRGPAYDGRIKPELIAYGEGGTSESAALVSGACLLIQQAYKEQHTDTLPPASLVKAVLINSADDTGRPGPDFDTGFGNLDALGAIKTIRDKRYSIQSIANNQTKALNISLPAGIHELKLTLVWHDPKASANAPAALVHDLDLELVHRLTGKRWKPWILNSYPHADSLKLPAIRQADHVNNVEQITLRAPEPGDYQVLLKGYAVAGGMQEYSLTYEYSQGFTWIFPVKESNLSADTAHLIRWEWHGPEAIGQLEYKLAGQEQWKPAQANILLSSQQVTFTTPDTATLAQVRLRTEDGKLMFTSEPFYISQPLALSVGFACEDVLLTWPSVKGISQYQLFSLGENFLEPLMLTSDTMVVLSKEQKAATYFAVAPVIEGKPVGKGLTADYTGAGLNCYIKSFLPRQLVTDTVLFDLQIGSLYELQSITLEKLYQGKYQSVQSISKPSALIMLLLDTTPLSGRNVYRVKMETTKKQYFYSQPEEVFYLRKGELLLYPNPVDTGQEVNILLGDAEQATIKIYDILGKLIKEVSESGVVKIINTQNLPRGTYFIHLQTDKGDTQTGKMVIY